MIAAAEELIGRDRFLLEHFPQLAQTRLELSATVAASLPKLRK
jgi:hypothetical protein